MPFEADELATVLAVFDERNKEMKRATRSGR